MFYSKSLLSRRGPLGNVWVAAHCYKRLKKEQVTGTNISSTVDKIIPDAQLSYRVLAHLLIGVVRIFSKKVDYLVHDCNEVLVCLGRIVLIVHKSTPKKEAGSQRQKPSSVKGTEEITLTSDLGGDDVADSSVVIRKSRHEPAFTIPRTFNLDSFDLEVPDEENQDLFRLEVEDEPEKLEFPNKRHDDDMFARSDFYAGCFTPGETCSDFYLSCFTPVQETTDFDFEGVERQQADKSNEIQSFDQVGKHSSARRALFISVGDRAEPHFPSTDVSQMPPTTEGNVEFQTPVKTSTRTSSPEITVTTPAIRECQRMSSKRKCLFDDIIVLPNQILREWIHSSSGLVSKRRKAPFSSLSSCRPPKTLSIKSRLEEPLIQSAILDKNAVRSAHRQPATAVRKLDFGEEISVETPPIESNSLDVPPTSRAEEEILQNFENEITMPDIESNSREEEVHNQDGLSTRTRSVARYLQQCFEKERARELHTLRILDGKNRTRCAQVFYETLVLKSRGYIDFKQETPYGEIIISAAAALKEISISRSG